MPWPTFLFWNALGGIAWATSVGLAAYFLGAFAAHLFELAGLAAAGVVAAAATAYLLWRWRRRRTGEQAKV